MTKVLNQTVSLWSFLRSQEHDLRGRDRMMFIQSGCTLLKWIPKRAERISCLHETASKRKKFLSIKSEGQDGALRTV